jgi:hypothetical protein
MDNQQPFNGNYVGVDGTLHNLDGGAGRAADETNNYMQPFYGVYTGSDGAEHGLEELLGGDGGSNPLLDTFAHKITAEMSTRSIYDFLHTDVGTPLALPAGTLITTTFSQEDIQEFAAITPSPSNGALSFHSISGQFQIVFFARRDSRGSVAELCVEWYDDNDGYHSSVIYDGLADGSGAFNNLVDWAQPKNYTYLNNSETLTPTNINGTYETVKELNLWRKCTAQSLVDTEIDLDEVRRSAMNATVSVNANLQSFKMRINHWGMNAVKTIPATLAGSDWVQDGGVYTQSLSDSHIESNSVGLVVLAHDVTGEQYDAWANGKVVVSGQTEGVITVTAFGEAPTIDISIYVLLWGNLT